MTVEVPLSELAELLEGRLEGDPRMAIRGVRAPEGVGAGEIAVIGRPQGLPDRPIPSGAAIVLAEGLELEADYRIFVADPRRAFRLLLDRFHPPRPSVSGIETGAAVAPGARVDPSAWVAAGATVGEGSTVGAEARLHPGVVVGEGCEVGPGCELFPHVVLYPGTHLGARVRVHAGTVLGADGFGFHRESGRWVAIPQVGTLVIEDDVEIGANCTLDRATLEATVVGRGSKLDNLVQVAHNVVIGPDSCLAAQVGISGSVRIGAGCVLGGQAGVADHARLEPQTRISAQAGVVDRAGPGEWGGTPAVPMRKARRAYLLLPELPAMLRELRRLRAEVVELRRRLDEAES